MSEEPETAAEVHVVSAAIVRDETCLVAERGTGMSFSRRWELPGGKVDPGEAPREALRREVLEELAVDVEVGRRIAVGLWESDGRAFRVEVYEATLAEGSPRPLEHSQHRWLRVEDLERLDWIGPQKPVLGEVRDHLRRRAAALTSPFGPDASVRRMNALAALAAEWATLPMAWTVAATATGYLMIAAGLRAMTPSKP